MHERISVIGLGKLGICLAVCAASKGMSVVGADVNPRVVAMVNRGEAPVMEPGLEQMLAHNRGRLSATTDIGHAVSRSGISFVVVPTPSEPSGSFSLHHVKHAAAAIGTALRNRVGYHLVVIVSTVLPGSMDFGVVPILEAASGRKCGADFGVCYGPEFIALGDVIRGMLRPDFVLIGRSDTRAGETLESFYRAFCDITPRICQMNFVNAEITKLAVNTFVTTKISFANMVAAICERIPGADIDVVTAALGCDSRIGERYLAGGLGYGGPCFPRDNRALAFTANSIGSEASLAEATDAFNKSYGSRVVRRIGEMVARGSSVAVLGLAYKPGTNVIEDSQPLAMVRALAQAEYRVTVFDPHATHNARRALGDRVRYADSVSACIAGAQAVIIATPAKEFRALGPLDFAGNNAPVVLFDCWRILRGRFSDVARVRYVALGIGEGGREAFAPLARLWSTEPTRAGAAGDSSPAAPLWMGSR